MKGWMAALGVMVLVVAAALLFVFRRHAEPANGVVTAKPVSYHVNPDTEAALGELAQGFVTDVGAGRLQQAYQKTSAHYRESVPFAKFQEIADHRLLHGTPAAALTAFKHEGEAIQATGGLTPQGMRPVLLWMQFASDPEGWKISGLSIGNGPALPAP